MRVEPFRELHKLLKLMGGVQYNIYIIIYNIIYNIYIHTHIYMCVLW